MNGFNKKHHGRKRVQSTTEQYKNFDSGLGRHVSSSHCCTKDSSSSSGAKLRSPKVKQHLNGQHQEPKNMYLSQLRQRIKESGSEPLSIIDLKDHIVEISQDQVGSRYIQKVYEKSSYDEKQGKPQS